MDFISIVYGMISVMVANILLGTNIARIKKSFDISLFLNGFLKAFLIIIACSLMYFCSYLNPEIVVANINGIEVNLINGMELLFVGGIISYGYQCLTKLKCILSLKCDLDKLEEEKK